MNITTTQWTNAGVIDDNGGAALTLVGTWNNQRGTISVANTTLNLGGIFTLGTLGTLHSTAATVNLTSTLDLAGATLALDATTGPWTLNGGTIKNGTITESGPGQLLIANNGGNTLDHVTVNGDLDETISNAQLNLVNGLILHGTLRIDRNSVANFVGTQTLAGGAVEFVGESGFLALSGGSSLTLGPGVVVHGKSGVLGGSIYFPGSGTLINQGLISADVAGGTLTINTTQFENTGTVEANGAGSSVVVRSNPFTNTGSIKELNGGKVVSVP